MIILSVFQNGYRKGNMGRVMFVYYYITLSYFMTGVCGSEILNAIFGQELSARIGLHEDEGSNEGRIVQLLSELPFTMTVKTVAWHSLLRYRAAQSLHLSDWKRYEPLIPYMPVNTLGIVNFSNNDILAYFGQQKLSQIQLSQVAEKVKSRRENVLQDENLILKLGNIFCGFTPKEFLEIKTSVLWSLLEKNFFQSINSCSTEQLKVLSKIMSQYKLLGPPRTWGPETVRQAGSLVAGLDASELREIRSSSFSEISSEVLLLIPVELLKEMKNSQLRALNKSALLTWRRRTRDLRQLHDNVVVTSSAQISLLTVTCACVFMCSIVQELLPRNELFWVIN